MIGMNRFQTIDLSKRQSYYYSELLEINQSVKTHFFRPKFMLSNSTVIQVSVLNTNDQLTNFTSSNVENSFGKFSDSIFFDQIQLNFNTGNFVRILEKLIFVLSKNNNGALHATLTVSYKDIDVNGVNLGITRQYIQTIYSNNQQIWIFLLAIVGVIFLICLIVGICQALLKHHRNENNFTENNFSITFFLSFLVAFPYSSLLLFSGFWIYCLIFQEAFNIAFDLN